MKKSRAEENFSHWLKTVHLKETFPELLQLEDPDFEERFFARDEGMEIARIIDAILGSPRTMVVFSPGHGTTTLFRAVMRQMNEDRALRLHVPVEVGHKERLASTTGFSESFLADVVAEVYWNLLSGGWEERLYGQRRQAFQRLFKTGDLSSFEQLLFEGRYQRENPETFRDFGAKHFKYGADDLGTLYRQLHEEVGIETILAFDFAHNVDEDLIFDVVGEIKYIDDFFRTDEFPPAALSEVYFCTDVQMALIKTSYQRDYNIYRVRSYSKAEVFAILATHYQARAGRKETALQTVLSPEFLSEVWDKRQTLNKMMIHLRSLLISQLDIAREEVTFEFYNRKDREEE